MFSVTVSGDRGQKNFCAWGLSIHFSNSDGGKENSWCVPEGPLIMHWMLMAFFAWRVECRGAWITPPYDKTWALKSTLQITERFTSVTALHSHNNGEG